ncbi:inositol monophosphatase family protein [Pseudonocardia phyllosphaerae]|uniref:inositol monophosphatase family protein n=1 Tax=Pseudonocardia phyllosphaerae TaxID=3390502 RepID=UPI00397E07E2
MSPTTEADVLLARRCAELAGAALLAERARPGPGLGDRGDRIAHEVIVGLLAAERPSDVVLSEEAADDPARLAADRVWIIDPLDGTREFADTDTVQWAVHVALWERGAGLTVAAVGLPGRGLVLDTAAPPVAPVAQRRLRIAVSRTRPPEVARQVASRLDAQLVPLGSAGYKIAAVLLGEADAYLHSGGQLQWDSAAPVAVAQAAGLHASRLDGAPLRYNVAELAIPDLLVASPPVAEAVLTAIGGRQNR